MPEEAHGNCSNLNIPRECGLVNARFSSGSEILVSCRTSMLWWVHREARRSFVRLVSRAVIRLTFSSAGVVPRETPPPQAVQPRRRHRQPAARMALVDAGAIVQREPFHVERASWSSPHSQKEALEIARRNPGNAGRLADCCRPNPAQLFPRLRAQREDLGIWDIGG